MKAAHKGHINCSIEFDPSHKLRLSSRCRGSGLIVVMCVLAIVTIAVGIAINSTGETARLSHRASNYVMVEKAAEGAVEHAFGIWKVRTMAKNSALTTAQANSNLDGPAFPGVDYGTAQENGPLAITATDEYGAPTDKPTRIYTSLLSYPGYQGFTYRYLASAKMRQGSALGGAAVAGVERRFEYTEVPLFQSMFFFEDDLVIAQPAEMIVDGLLHTNSNLYLNGSSYGSLTVSGNASYSGNYTETIDPPFIDSWSPWAPDAKTAPIYPDGKNEQLSKVSRMEPLGDKPSAVLNDTDSNPNNDSFHELVEPPTSGYSDPPEIAERRLYNKAGIIMQIETTIKSGSPSTTVTIKTQNGTTVTGGRKNDLENAVSTTSFYDQREGKTITVNDVDMSAVSAILDSSDVRDFNGVLYVYDVTSESVDANPKAIRLKDGGVLPDNGLTIASEDAIYIQGDYNTGTTTLADGTTTSLLVPSNLTGNPSNNDSPVVPGYTQKPAAVIGDAVMLLSNSWNDSNAALDINQRRASNTTFNTAILSGFIPSGWVPPGGGAAYGYSGGAINFPRFLEQWTGKSCTYYGSMVELFQSKEFIGEWDTGNIYNPPHRRWNYDTLFSSTPPPGSLDAVVITRGSWAKF